MLSILTYTEVLNSTSLKLYNYVQKSIISEAGENSFTEGILGFKPKYVPFHWFHDLN